MATFTAASASTEARIRTRRDFEALGEGPPYYELVEGELILMTAPNRFHQKIAANLFRALDREVHPHSLGEVYFAPFDVYFDLFNAHEPDLVFISKARAHILTDAGAEGAPDLVVEILSPKTARLNRNKKRLVFTRVKPEVLAQNAGSCHRAQVIALILNGLAAVFDFFRVATSLRAV